jgi:peptidoglycan hydrolase-like protein with peptidoglycan-binding domain
VGAPAAETIQTPRQRYADWPQKGDQRPQPWDLDAVGIPPSERNLPAGAPNTISPVVIRHSYPILASGSAGAVVNDLAGRLALLGYPTDISQGQNPFGVLSDQVMSAVERFREDYGVQEDPTPFGGNTEKARQRATGIVGPYTWEALVRASDRAAAALQA